MRKPTARPKLDHADIVYLRRFSEIGRHRDSCSAEVRLFSSSLARDALARHAHRPVFDLMTAVPLRFGRAKMKAKFQFKIRNLSRFSFDPQHITRTRFLFSLISIYQTKWSKWVGLSHLHAVAPLLCPNFIGFVGNDVEFSMLTLAFLLSAPLLRPFSTIDFMHPLRRRKVRCVSHQFRFASVDREIDRESFVFITTVRNQNYSEPLRML